MDEELDEMTLAQPVPALDGGLSAAILLMLLEDGDSSSVLQHLDPAEVKSLAKGMFEASCATEIDVENALEVFVSNNRDLSNLAVGVARRHVVLSLQLTHLLCATKALGKHVNECGVYVVNAVTQCEQRSLGGSGAQDVIRSSQ